MAKKKKNEKKKRKEKKGKHDKNDLQNTTKTIDRETRKSHNTGLNSERIVSFCSTSDTRSVTLVTTPVIRYG